MVLKPLCIREEYSALFKCLGGFDHSESFHDVRREKKIRKGMCVEAVFSYPQRYWEMPEQDICCALITTGKQEDSFIRDIEAFEFFIAQNVVAVS